MVGGVIWQSGTQGARLSETPNIWITQTEIKNSLVDLCLFTLTYPNFTGNDPRLVWRMRRTSFWVCWALCLCASLAASAQDYPEDDQMILDLIREDGTEPETGAEPAAEFLRCNKVIIIYLSEKSKHFPRTPYSLFLPAFEHLTIISSSTLHWWKSVTCNKPYVWSHRCWDVFIFFILLWSHGDIFFLI